MKILVTGSRDWDDKNAIVRALARHSGGDFRNVTVIHGDQRGADKLAGIAATELGMKVVPYPADWKRYGDAAGPLRNLTMIVMEHANREKPPIDLCLAFPLPGSKGTRHMMTFAKHAGIRVIEALRMEDLK